MKKLTTKQGVNYVIRRCPARHGFFFDRWLPSWHNGRGYYLSVGLWWFEFHRGY